MSHPQIFVPEQQAEIRVGAEGDRVLLTTPDGKIHSLPWEVALPLARGLAVKGRQAEAHAKVHQTVDDQALLLRAGVRVGFTSDPKVKAAALKEATHDRDLRRAIPSTDGLEHTAGGGRVEKMGIPTIIRHDPPEPVETKAEDLIHD